MKILYLLGIFFQCKIFIPRIALCFLYPCKDVKDNFYFNFWYIVTELYHQLYLLVYCIMKELIFPITANSGAAAGGILFFVTYIPYFFLQPRYQTLTWAQKILSSLIFNVGMAYGGQIIGMYEGTG